MLPLFACGGNSGSKSGGGNPPPPTTTEILYAISSNATFAFKIDQTGGVTQTASVSPGASGVGGAELALTGTGSFLYALNDGGAGINAYATDKSGALSLTSGSPFPIPGVQSFNALGSVTVDPKGKFLYVGTSTGFGGINSGITSFSIDSSSGALTCTGGPFTLNPGESPLGIAINPAGTYLYATAGDGYVWAFSINSQNGTLSTVQGSPFNVPGQAYGIQVDPSGKFVYIALSNLPNVVGFTINSASGALIAVPGSPFATSFQVPSYELTIHPSGKFLYAGNNNILAAFTIDLTTGALNPITGSPFTIARNAGYAFTADPSGRYLFLPETAASNAFVVLDVNTLTGALTPNAQSPTGGPVQPIGAAIVQFQ